MKRLSMLAILLFAPASFADSEAVKGGAPAKVLVQRTLIEPLAAKENNQSKFSRARMPAQERRVRILDETPRQDARGGKFVRFAVDARHGFRFKADDEASWRQAAITGCVYVDRGEVFVKKGDEHRPAAFLLGKNVKAAGEQICQGEPQVAKAD
jgi:hypothetical protein